MKEFLRLQSEFELTLKELCILTGYTHPHVWRIVNEKVPCPYRFKKNVYRFFRDKLKLKSAHLKNLKEEWDI